MKVMSTEQTYNADRLGIFTPKQIDRTELKCGEVGWLVCAIKDIHGAPVGDTLTLARNPAERRCTALESQTSGICWSVPGKFRRL